MNFEKRTSSITYLCLVFVFCLCIIDSSKRNRCHGAYDINENKLVFDYTLYSQLLNELASWPTTNKSSYQNASNANATTNHKEISPSVGQYYALNQRQIEEYNKYLFFPESERLKLKELARDMFQFGYDNYMNHAFPNDELDPINCKGRGPDYLNQDNININDVLGDYLLTLVDSLSSLVVFGNTTEFKKATRLVIDNLNFDKNNTVQVFEATIRVLGSLISAHLIIIDSNQPFGDFHIENYNDELLHLAHDLGIRLLSAFDNKETSLPYPRVNLKYGPPSNSFNHTCTSGAGTLLLEFGMLSNLLDDPVYEFVARKAMEAIYSYKHNVTGLLGNELHIKTGEWLGIMSGMGAGIDSYFEYFVKSYVVFGKDSDYEKFESIKMSLKKYLRHGREECLHGDGHHPLYLNVNMNSGNILNNWIDSLAAFYPSVQVLDGDLEEAICFHALYFAIWKKFDILPERFNWKLKLPDVYFYPLRPEFAEATYFLYRATHNPFYLHVAKLIIENINQYTKVKCGFATVHHVVEKTLEDRMESFFLSETLKYLYLIFDKENYLNNKGESEYIFSTEGHFYSLKQAHNLNLKRKNEKLIKKKKKKKNKSHFRLVRKGSQLIQNHANESSINLNASDNVYSFSSTFYDISNATNLDEDFLTYNNEDNEKKCKLKMSSRKYYDMRFNLPMKMSYFDQLFDMVGVHDKLEAFV